MSQLGVLRNFLPRRGCPASPLQLQWCRVISVSQLLQQVRKVQQGGSNSAGGLRGRSLQQSSGRTDVSTDVRPLGEKIKENTKTASYTAIIIAGVGVTAIMFWAICRELFSSSSPNNIYSDALERVKEDTRVQDAIGAPIKGFGEESRRGRRQRVAHSNYERNGVRHTRMQFYVQGIRNRATVHLESRMTSSGKMEYRYLFVQLDHYPHTTIILEDNRAFDPQASGVPPQLGASSLELTSYNQK